MRRSHWRFLWAGALLLVVGVTASAEESKEAAITKDRQLIAGTWRVVALKVDGDESKAADIEKLSVVNDSTGRWKVLSEGKQIAEGTSQIDPTKKPKAIDLTLTEADGKGKTYLAIYELGETTRKLCIAQAGKERPTEFSSSPGSEQILVTFEREKKTSDQGQKDR